MNVFYAPPNQIHGEQIELTGQEANHASNVLRYQEGDSITIVDGKGGWYEGQVIRILRDAIQVKVENKKKKSKPGLELVMAFGIIKKRDRLEFAVEKAVELGASEIVLFRSEHTVKKNVRMDRLESTALSAMKQSLRTYLPAVSIYPSVKEVVANYNSCKLLIAHEKKEPGSGMGVKVQEIQAPRLLLLVGPEGGFSEEEISFLREEDAVIVSLGPQRLRTETAVITFLSQFIDRE